MGFGYHVGLIGNSVGKIELRRFSEVSIGMYCVDNGTESIIKNSKNEFVACPDYYSNIERGIAEIFSVHAKDINFIEREFSGRQRR